MLPNDELLMKWEGIIDTVSKTNMPLECIKKVVLKLQGGKQKTFNIHSMRSQGMEFEEIEILLGRALDELEPITKDIEYVVDINSVASIIQPETDKLLGKL